MGFCSTVCRNIFVGLLSLIKVGVCVAIICIVSIHLYSVDVYTQDGKYKVNVDCLMAGKVKGGDVCEYTYAVCGLSMLLSFLTSLFLCVTCDLCGFGDWLQFIIQAFQTAWWIIAAIVISDRVDESNDYRFPDGSKMPKKGWRNAIAVLAWINAMIAAILALVYLVQAVKCLRNACGCCGGKDDDNERKKEKKSKKNEQDPAVTAGANPYGAPQPVAARDEAVRANAV